jgi:DNA polymerase-3 subunit alpha
VELAATLGQPAIGITNHGHAYSAPALFAACEKYGIKGIIGMEIYEAVPHTFDTDPEGPDHKIFKDKWDPNVQRYHHLTLWVENQKGWENLCAIHTKSFTKGYKPKNQPLVDRAMLEQHSEGLIVGLGCIQSRTNVALQKEGFDAATKAADWYFDVFDGRAYVEVMSALPEQIKLLADQRKLAKRYGRPTVGTNDVHYLRQGDGVLGGAHHMLVMARKHRSADTAASQSTDASDDAFGSWYGSDQFYIKTRAEMIQSGIFPQEIDVTLDIMNRIEFKFFDMPDPQPPQARVPVQGEDPAFDEFLLTNQ